MNSYYSMMVQLSDRSCIVIGGGSVAERKIAALMEAGAKVAVISPAFTPLIENWIQEGRIQGVRREYSSLDGELAFLVIAATNDESINVRVYQDAHERNQFINVVDRPDLSSFINPSSFTKGKLQISVSTSGTSPSLAKRIREELEVKYGEEYEVYLDFLSEFRLKVKEQVQDPKRRQQIFKDIMQIDVLQLIQEGEFERFKTEMMERLGGSYADIYSRYKTE